MEHSNYCGISRSSQYTCKEQNTTQTNASEVVDYINPATLMLVTKNENENNEQSDECSRDC